MITLFICYNKPNKQIVICRGENMKCPICQNETFDDKDYEYQICEECFWEYDLLQVKNPNLSGGANKQSLNEYKKKYDSLKQNNPNFRRFVKK